MPELRRPDGSAGRDTGGTLGGLREDREFQARLYLRIRSYRVNESCRIRCRPETRAGIVEIVRATGARLQDVVEVLWVNAPIPVLERSAETVEWRVRATRGLIKWINNLAFDAKIKCKDLAGRLLDTALAPEGSVPLWVSRLADAKSPSIAGGTPWITAVTGSDKKPPLPSANSTRRPIVRSRKPPAS